MYFENDNLLSPPISRAAYSDRTAWLMAEISRLVYFKFEGEAELKEVAKAIASSSDEKKIGNILVELLEEKRASKVQAEAELKAILVKAGFALEKSFNEKGTQAFLLSSDKYKMNVLAFRGTEKDPRDIKADINAFTVEKDGCMIHQGFYNAFECVRPDIVAALEDIKGRGNALYITGHSLGGALALLATKFLAEDSVGACYTFGSPRVASTEFGDSIKTPIYRVVNAADLVPRLPPAYIPHIFIAVFEVLNIPFLSDFVVNLLHKLRSYRHHGDMRFLTVCKSDFSDLRLLQNPTIIDLAMRLIKRLSFNWKAGATDHFIQNYCDKLAAYAERRQ